MRDHEMGWVSALSPALLQGQSIQGAIQSKMSQSSSVQAPRCLFEIFNDQNTPCPRCHVGQLRFSKKNSSCSCPELFAASS